MTVVSRALSFYLIVESAHSTVCPLTISFDDTSLHSFQISDKIVRACIPNFSLFVVHILPM